MDEKEKKDAAENMVEKKGSKLEGLPVDTSPYTQYKDLEDYKKQGYGTQGHQDPNPRRGAAASTDAPTAAADLTSTDAINRQGVP